MPTTTCLETYIGTISTIHRVKSRRHEAYGGGILHQFKHGVCKRLEMYLDRGMGKYGVDLVQVWRDLLNTAQFNLNDFYSL